jgi:hypothetical protein
MSDLFYPASLPGRMFHKKRSVWVMPNFVLSASARETGVGYETFPRWEWTLTYEFLRETASLTEMQDLVGFFNARFGPLDDFLFTDPDESSVSALQFGTGTGSQTQFPLARLFGGFAEPVGYAVPSSITVNGTPTALYTLLSNRIVQFNSAPANGAVLRWTGTYAYRCRFVDPDMEMEKFLSMMWKSSGIKIRSRKP